MQFSKLLISAFAAVAAAAPATSSTQGTALEKRTFLGAGQLSALNGLNFGIDTFAYLSQINNFGLNFFDAQLFGLFQQGFDIGIFGGLFGANIFDVNALIQFIQLQTLLQVSSFGVFGGFNLAGVNLINPFQFGVLGNSLGAFNLGGILDNNVLGQVNSIALNSGLFGGFGAGFGGIGGGFGFKKE